MLSLLIVFLFIIRAYDVLAEFKLQILHTNDMHARFDQTDTYGGSCPSNYAEANKCFGGFARVKQAVKEAKAEAHFRGIPSIFINAGDNFQGTPYYTLFKWKIMSPLIDLMEIDVMSLGNHEFDDGIDNLVSYLKNVSTLSIACNLNITSERRLELPMLKPSTILIVNGTKIGVIGYITPDTKELSKTENLQIFDEIRYIRAEAQRMKKEGVNVIIALGHSGLDRDKEIAAQVPELSMVVGGHSHSLLYHPKEKPPSIDTAVDEYPFFVLQKSGKKVPVVQAFCFTKYLGNITVTFDDNGNVNAAEGNPILLDSRIKQDPEIQAKVVEWRNKVKEELDVVKGYTRVFLSMPNRINGQYESNVANLITDAFVDYAVKVAKDHNSKAWVDSPIAIMQIGGIRSQIDNTKNGGAITLEDILTLAPFQTPMTQVTLKGSTLRTAIEQSVNTKDVSKGFQFFLFFSGLRVRYDFSKPPGSRVKSVEVLCKLCFVPEYEPLKLNETYTVIMTEYLTNGGDKFEMFKIERLNVTTFVVTDSDLITAYIEKRAIVYPGIEGRILVSSSNQQKCNGFFYIILVVPLTNHIRSMLLA